MARPAPLAVGLIRLAPDVTVAERRGVRVRFGAWALREGYALVETFEINGRAVRDEAAAAGLCDLVARCSVPTLIVADDVPAQFVRRAQAVGELRTLTVAPEVVGVRSGTADSQTRSKLAR